CLRRRRGSWAPALSPPARLLSSPSAKFSALSTQVSPPSAILRRSTSTQRCATSLAGRKCLLWCASTTSSRTSKGWWNGRTVAGSSCTTRTRRGARRSATCLKALPRSSRRGARERALRCRDACINYLCCRQCEFRGRGQSRAVERYRGVSNTRTHFWGFSHIHA
ncbi:hypothetical protein T484DRAFT_1899891, partial [Baffinella frigidus]